MLARARAPDTRCWPRSSAGARHTWQQPCPPTRSVVQGQPLHRSLQLLKAVGAEREDACREVGKVCGWGSGAGRGHHRCQPSQRAAAQPSSRPAAGTPANTIDLAWRKPGRAGTGRRARCHVSPTRAAGRGGRADGAQWCGSALRASSCHYSPQECCERLPERVSFMPTNMYPTCAGATIARHKAERTQRRQLERGGEPCTQLLAGGALRAHTHARAWPVSSSPVGWGSGARSPTSPTS